MKQQRGVFRVPLERAGQLRRGTELAACEIQKLTPQGVGLRSDLRVEPGETLELDFELAKGCLIHCVITVTHAAHPKLGGRITDIAPDQQVLLARFLDELAVSALTGW
ncbi:PilZ domain-containing protein [Nitrospira sp. Kam-Ns4a]